MKIKNDDIVFREIVSSEIHLFQAFGNGIRYLRMGTGIARVKKGVHLQPDDAAAA